MARVYLAGPITGMSYQQCTEWREYFKSRLPIGIDGYSPMRGKDYLSEEKEISDSYEDTIMSNPRAIIARDYNDVKNADMIVVNMLGAERVSIGTVMEIGWAKVFQIPMVLVMENEGNPHEHSFVTYNCDFRVETVEDALHVVKSVLCPDPTNAMSATDLTYKYFSTSSAIPPPFSSSYYQG